MARPRRTRITREGLYYILVLSVILIGATSRQLNLLMLIGCVLLGPLLFSLLYGRWAIGKIAVARRLPSSLHAGERLRVDVQISNLRRLGLWGMRVDDQVEHLSRLHGEKASAGVFFPYLPRNSDSASYYEGTLPYRGRYRFGPLRVSTRFPMGLVQHTLTLAGTAELLVHPKLGRLQPGWLKQIREDESGSQRMTRRGLLEADFYGLREWRAGDSRRWIHWRTSARRGGLIVQQFEQRRSQNLAILVDLWQPAKHTAEATERVESAVSFAATLLTELCRRPGAQLHLEVAAAESFANAGAGSPIYLREQMDALAMVSPHERSEFPVQLGHALAMIPAATPTILLSTRPVNWEDFSRAAAERETQIDVRTILEIEVHDEMYRRFYEEGASAPTEGDSN
jgi:uncharacterized protein (DUF58 family)